MSRKKHEVDKWMGSPSWKTDLQKTLRLVRSDKNHKKPPVKAALYTEYGKHKSSSGSMMPSSRLFTAFCILLVGAKGENVVAAPTITHYPQRI